MRRDEEGMTVVELLVAMAIGSILAAITVATVMNAFDAERRTVARIEALNDAKIALERITRDVRGADPVVAAEEDRITVAIDPDREVTYALVDVDGRPTLRVTTEAGGETTERDLVRGLEHEGLAFAYRDVAGEEDPAALADIHRVRVTVRVTTSGEEGPIVLRDEVTLRNHQGEEVGP